MLAGGTDALYRAARRSPHRLYTRIEVYSGAGVLLESDLTFMSGTVSATLNSRVTRTCSFSVHEDLYPVRATDLLAPYGNFIRAYRGIQLGDDSTKYVWQVFGGRIQETSLESSGEVRVTCSDRAADVIDNGFEAPVSSSVGILATEQAKILIADGFPGAQFGDFDTFDQVMSNLTWDSDRGDALDQIGRGLGAFWYCLATEEFVIRHIPWTVGGEPVVFYNDGDGGTVTGYQVTRSRSDVYNSVTATAERLDGSAPQYATARDNNSASPTLYGGNFGIRTRQVRTQNPATQGAAQSLADDYLRSSKALTESWEISIIPDPALELGDIVGLEVAGRTEIVQVAQSFTLPLDTSGPQRVSLRAQVPNLLEE